MKTKGERLCFIGNRKKIEKECLYAHETYRKSPVCIQFLPWEPLKREKKEGKIIIYPCEKCQGKFFKEV